MEEMRDVALAHYANGDNESKEMVEDFFHNMDVDGNGCISFQEFSYFVQENCPEMFRPELFAELDLDGDGVLDLNEVIVLCYMVSMRTRWCQCCGDFLKRVYFTCAACFLNKSSEEGYDLCVNCYKNKKFIHAHKLFMDNYSMLNILQSESKKKELENALRPNNFKTKKSRDQIGSSSRNINLHPTCNVPKFNAYAMEPMYNFYEIPPLFDVHNQVDSLQMTHKVESTQSSTAKGSLVAAVKAFNTGCSIGHGLTALAIATSCTIM